MTTQTAFFDDGLWVQVERCHPQARALADRHYSRQTPGAREFMSSGKTLVLLTRCARAVWGCIENLDPAGKLRWRCSVFRNEGGGKDGDLVSSDLVREATVRTFEFWRRTTGIPSVPLQTEVDPKKTRTKRDPGRCFRKAGWFVVDKDRRGLVILQAPEAA